MRSLSRRGFLGIMASLLPLSMLNSPKSEEPEILLYYGDIIHGYNYPLPKFTVLRGQEALDYMAKTRITL